MRARISAFADLHYIDGNGEPVVGAAMTGFASSLSGSKRLATLFSHVCQAAMESLPEGLSFGDLPLLLCTREKERPGSKLNGLVAKVEELLGLAFRRQGSSHIASGPVSAFEALALARRHLVEGDVRAVLIGCVDSLIDARSLLWLEETQRLKTSTRSDGLIPGEAACVLLASAEPLTHSCLRVDGLGFAVEAATVLNDEPLMGGGMATAIRMATSEAGVEMHQADFRLSDVAGESYAFEELALAQSRVMRTTRETQDLWPPASSVGDCGAAAGAIQLAWAEQAFARSYAPGRLALAHSSAYAGARAVAVVSAPGVIHVA